MQVALNFKDEMIAKKVLWVIDRFKNDGVEVVILDDQDSDIIDGFRDSIREIEQIEKGKLNSKPIEEFLNEL